ncbi:MAG TPA: M20/M25/M40 family metallo-hydrolase [Xanthomonadales bacterium]|nr:M20/M25/M40 family metallo-hydrolase [Xanthomonadales bacterium]
MRTLFVFSLPLLFLLPDWVNAQADPASVARAYRMQNEQAIVDGFAELLAIPNVASDSVNIRRNADYISNLFAGRNFEVQLLEIEGSPPAVFAERRAEGAGTTLMIYIHYDGQPANPEDWASDPWTPVLRNALVEQGGELIPMTAPFDPESRLFARSAGDDKAPIPALLAAIDALDEAGVPLAVNLKLFMEGEEEAGSPHLEEMLHTYRDLLGADLWLFCDGPVHQSRLWQLSYGVRGAYGFNLTVYGPNRPLHSGHYGNWAPNPIMRLVELIGSMRDGAGNILIEGYYDQVVPPSLTELEAIAAAPEVDSSLKQELGVLQPETNERVELAILRPALNLRGIRSGDVGDAARNAIQTSASASIGLRLVPDQTPAFLRDVIERHIRDQGYFIVHKAPTAEERATYERIARLDWEGSGYPAYRAQMDLPIAQKVAALVNELGDGSLIQLPTMGGSLPLYLIDEAIGAPILILPIANHDNNQHGSDENLRLQNLWDAIEIYAAVLTGL